MKNMKFEHQITVCKSNKTGLYSIRKEGYLFWTGIKTNEWVDEKDGDKIWEHDDRELVQIFSDLVQYALVNEKPINEIIEENPLEGADKLSKQIITSEWAKMPQIKQEGEMKEKEYVVLQDIMTITADKIKLKVGTDFVGSFDMSISTMYIPTDKIDKFIQQGIIAEKKSKREEIAEKIQFALATKHYNDKDDYKEIILEELEKAGIE